MSGRTRYQCNRKSMMNENADNDQNSGNDDDDDQGETTENEFDNSVNVL